MVASFLFSITFAAVFISSPLGCIESVEDVAGGLIGRIVVALPVPYVLWLIYGPFSRDISAQSGEDIRRVDGAGIYDAQFEFEIIRRILKLTGLRITNDRKYDDIEWNQVSVAVKAIKKRYV